MWRKALRHTALFYGGLVADILMIIVSIIIALYIAPSDPLSIDRWFEDTILIYGIYSLVVLVSLFPIILLHKTIIVHEEEIKLGGITKLGKFRTEGVALRNKCSRLKIEEQLNQWIAEYNGWHARTLEQFAKVNQARAELWNTLNRVDRHVKIEAINRNHQSYLDIMETKLARLETELDNMLKNLQR
jgi:hypothetical protein